MNILLLAPTQFELEAIQFNHKNLTKGVCGIGATEVTSYIYTALPKQVYNQVILIGLAGGLKEKTTLGDVYKIEQDIQGDLGVYEKRQFISFEELGLITSAPLQKYNLCNKILPDVIAYNSLSTNILFESENMNVQRHQYFGTTLENMEGAAFQTSCERNNINHLQLRAISNYIGERDKRKWLMTKALANLNKTCSTYLKNILCD